ncbi:MAG TPA: hypothetical protein VKI44_15200 [Acetobacteraceae bacterium]|nr:hypothetical protein [Acetobacteraceae bacterium]
MNKRTDERITAEIEGAFSASHRVVVEFSDYRNRVGFQVKTTQGVPIYTAPVALKRLYQTGPELASALTIACQDIAKQRPVTNK